MTAVILSGKEVAQRVLESLRTKIQTLKSTHGVTPHLTIFQVGDRKDSTSYIKAKVKAAEKIGKC